MSMQQQQFSQSGVSSQYPGSVLSQGFLGGQYPGNVGGISQNGNVGSMSHGFQGSVGLPQGIIGGMSQGILGGHQQGTFGGFPQQSTFGGFPQHGFLGGSHGYPSTVLPSSYGSGMMGGTFGGGHGSMGGGMSQSTFPGTMLPGSHSGGAWPGVGGMQHMQGGDRGLMSHIPILGGSQGWSGMHGQSVGGYPGSQHGYGSPWATSPYSHSMGMGHMGMGHQSPFSQQSQVGHHIPSQYSHGYGQAGQSPMAMYGHNSPAVYYGSHNAGHHYGGTSMNRGYGYGI